MQFMYTLLNAILELNKNYIYFNRHFIKMLSYLKKYVYRYIYIKIIKNRPLNNYV